MAELLLELFSEEIPARMQARAADDLRRLAAGALKEVATAAEGAPEMALVPAGEARLLPPIPAPPKILCIGLNYRSHAEETGLAIPDYPIVFPRWPKSVVADGVPLVCPAASNKFDYEAELLIVIGTGGRVWSG